MPQMNYMSMADTYGRGVKDLQAQEMNKLAIESAQAEFDDATRLKNAQWLTAIGKAGLEMDPSQYPQFMPQIEQEGQRRGVWERIGDGKFDYTTASPEVIRSGFQNLYDQGMMNLKGMSGPPAEDISAADTPYAQRDPVTNQVSQVGATPKGPTSPVANWRHREWMKGQGYSDEEIGTYDSYVRAPHLVTGSQGEVVVNPANPGASPPVVPGTEPVPMRERKAADVASETRVEEETKLNVKAERERPRLVMAQRQQINDTLGTIQNVDRAVGLANWWSTGVASQIMDGLGATDARSLKAALQPIMATLAFDRLRQMRENSKTGGALGQVSERELDLLMAAREALDQAQQEGEIVDALMQVRTHYERVLQVQRGQEALLNGARFAATPQEAMDFPSGTIFVTPDGYVKRVP